MASLVERATLAFAEWQASENTWHDNFARATQLTTALAFGITGLAFFVKPVECAEYVGLKMLNSNGVTEVRAFYGSMEMLLGLALGMTSCGSSLAVSGAILLGASSGRLLSTRTEMASAPPSTSFTTFDTLLHPKIAFMEAFGAFICLYARTREVKAKAQQDAAVQSLQRRQSPDPQKLADFVPYCAENLQDPYPWYHALREEAPVCKPLGLDYYLVSRAQDIQEVCRDTETFSSKLVAILFQGPGGKQSSLDVQGMEAFTGGVVDVLALQDAPVHTIQRKSAFIGLSPKLFAAMDEKIRVKAREMLRSRFQGNKCVDWMDALAFRLPMLVALELCGFPSDETTARRVKAQADHGVALMSGTNTPQDFVVHAAEARKLFKWIQAEFARVMQDGTHSDFMASLMAGIKSGDLSRNEAESIILQILLAGNDSSAATMGSAMKILCERPDIQAALRKDPTGLIPVFVEEVLRYESPFGGHFRCVKRPTELGGVNLKPGDRVMLLWASANRDERFWETPDEFKLDRGAKGKTHFSFGKGVHLCLGNSLARREVRMVIEEVLAMFANIKTSQTAPKSFYVPSSFTRCLARYYVDLSD